MYILIAAWITEIKKTNMIQWYFSNNENLGNEITEELTMKLWFKQLYKWEYLNTNILSGCAKPIQVKDKALYLNLGQFWANNQLKV